MSKENAILTMHLKPDSKKPEFRGPVCPEWEMWWKKIALQSTYKGGYIYMNDRVVGARYMGNLQGDPDIFENELEMGEGFVIVKNHLREERLRSFIGVKNGLTVIDTTVFTVEVAGVTEFNILRAAQESEQQILRSFFLQCIR